MKKLLIIACIFLFYISNIFAQENLSEILLLDGKTFKVTYYPNRIIKEKEEISTNKEADNSQTTTIDYFESFNEDGIMVFKGRKTTGMQYYFYENGTKKIVGSVLNTVKNGRWTYYDEEGNFIKTDSYKDGVLTGSR